MEIWYHERPGKLRFEKPTSNFYISLFLSDRNFRVRIGTSLSDSFEQEQGVPQGSISPVTLFSIKSKTQGAEHFIDGAKVPIVNEAKFLGVIFDKKLTFIPHIKYLKA